MRRRPRRPRRGVRAKFGPAACAVLARRARFELGPGRAAVSVAARYVELYKVTSTTEVSRAEFAISGKVTRLGVGGPEPRQTVLRLRARNQRLCAVRAARAGTVPGHRRRSAAIGCRLRCRPTGLRPGRTADRQGRARGRRRERWCTRRRSSACSRIRCGAMLTITPPLPAALERDTVVVHANVALATHGETVLADPRRGRREQELPALRAQAPAADLSQRRQRDRRRQRAHACASTTSNGPSGRRCSAPRPPSAPTRSAPTSRARPGSCSATACAARGCRAG